MAFEWVELESAGQITLSREALTRARHVIAAQAMLLAENMEHGKLQNLDGPDALRLLAMILSEE
jgi:hypothetical protein